jgi:hypothetical protein
MQVLVKLVTLLKNAEKARGIVGVLQLLRMGWKIMTTLRLTVLKHHL